MEASICTVNARQNEVLPSWDEENGRPVWGPKTFAMAQKFLSRFDNIPYEDREDIIQDFSSEHPNMEGFDGKSKFSTWFYSCLSNLARDFLRKRDQTRVNEDNRRKFVIMERENEEGEIVNILDELSKEEESVVDAGMDYYDYYNLDGPHNPAHFYFWHLKWGEPVYDFWSEHLDNCAACDNFLKKMLAKKLSPEEERKGFPLIEKSRKIFYKVAYADKPVLQEIKRGWSGPDQTTDHFELFTTRGMIRCLTMEEVRAVALAEEALKAKAEYEQKRDQAIKELLGQQKQIAQQLTELGYEGNTISKTKGQRVCSNCEKPGHNAKTCKEPKKHPNSHKKEHK